jgi:CheY-like chemotaxis protein
VPDEKMPRDRALRATCKKCGKAITIEARGESTAPASGQEATMGVDATLAEVTEAPTAIAVDLDIDSAFESPLEVLEEGGKSALVCVDEPERLKAVNTALDELAYYISVASSVKEALSKLRYNHYDLVVLDEVFCGETAENNTILRYLQPMPMSSRRRIFLMLVSQQGRTLDNLVAFAKSVNVVINANDVQRVKLVLERALAEHRRFYKVYMDCLQAIGAV